MRHKIPADRIVARTVPCFTLATLLREYGFASVDLVQIDAEGHDYEIIKTIDGRPNRRRLFASSTRILPRSACDECLTLLASRGYRFLAERRDTIAFLERPAASGKIR